jgi:undecaprenyl-diphosphatase
VVPSSIRVYTIIALVLFTWVAAEVVAGRTADFDSRVRLAVHAHSSPELTSALRFLTNFGEPAVLIALSVAATAALVSLRPKRAALLFVITMVAGFLLDFTLKLAFRRARPPASFFGMPMPDSYSFPSGHALFSVCFLGTLALLISARVRSRLGRVAIWLAAALLAGSIGFSRIYLGVHYPADVIAGYAAGAILVSMAAAFLREY